MQQIVMRRAFGRGELADGFTASDSARLPAWTCACSRPGRTTAPASPPQPETIVTASGSSTRLVPDTVPLAEGCDAVRVRQRRRRRGDAAAACRGRRASRRAPVRRVQPRRLERASWACRSSRVPAYSPNAVAEHTLALILAVNRHIPRLLPGARLQLSLEGLVGFDLKGKTAGVVGTGKIGALVARLLWHFRCGRAFTIPSSTRVSSISGSPTSGSTSSGRNATSSRSTARSSTPRTTWSTPTRSPDASAA